MYKVWLLTQCSLYTNIIQKIIRKCPTDWTGIRNKVEKENKEIGQTIDQLRQTQLENNKKLGQIRTIESHIPHLNQLNVFLEQTKPWVVLVPIRMMLLPCVLTWLQKHATFWCVDVFEKDRTQQIILDSLLQKSYNLLVYKKKSFGSIYGYHTAIFVDKRVQCSQAQKTQLHKQSMQHWNNLFCKKIEKWHLDNKTVFWGNEYVIKSFSREKAVALYFESHNMPMPIHFQESIQLLTLLVKLWEPVNTKESISGLVRGNYQPRFIWSNLTKEEKKLFCEIPKATFDRLLIEDLANFALWVQKTKKK